MSRPSPDGVLVVDKPAGLTSHDVVARVRRLAGTRRVGHAGTLDPMATGVLVVGVGQATRLLGHLAAHDKEYDGTIRLGTTTSTDDAAGEILETTEPERAAAVDDAAIAAAIAALTGELAQVPPAVSAIKVDGRRAYARARAGETVELAARPVRVHRFEVVQRRGPDLDVRVACSAGTYVRSLARDLGAALGVGGHLTALRRVRSGGFTLAEASPLDDLDVARDLLPLAAAAARSLPVLSVAADEAERIRHGQRRVVDGASTGGPLAVLDPAGVLVAIVEVRDTVAHPLAVFADR